MKIPSYKGSPLPPDLLTERELELLCALQAQGPNEVLTAKELGRTKASLSQAIKGLRNKLRKIDPQFNAISTIYGVGVVWKEPEA